MLGNLDPTAIMQLRLRWRADLLSAPRETSGKPGYLIEDRVTGQFHRLGEREYQFAVALDGSRPLAEIVQRFRDSAAAAATLQTNSWQPQTLLALIHWLIDNGLVEVFAADGKPLQLQRPKAKASWDPFFFRYALMRSPPFFGSLLPAVQFLFSRHAVVMLTLASVWLGIQLSVRWEELRSSADGIFVVEQHGRLLLVWLLLKVIHELGHGLVCQRYGGEVRELGVSLIFGMPTPYVDVTSAWRFATRWQRMATSLAGMYAEWWLAVAAGAIWLAVDAPATRQLCVQILSLIGLGTLAFNANPLMRFDGYFVLADLLDLPNLASESARFWNDLWLRIGWGLPVRRTFRITRTDLIFAGYGLLALVWRVLTLAVLAGTAIVMYEGIGWMLVLIAGLLWFGRGMAHRAQNGFKLLRESPLRLLRPTLIVGTAGAAIVLFTIVLPWPFTPEAVGIIRHQDEIVLRVDSPGIVRELLVRDGDLVAAGDLLLRLQNDELELQRRQLAAAVAASGFKARQLQQEKKLVEWRTEAEHHDNLRAQYAELDRKVNALDIRAPATGRLFARRWSDWQHRYLPAGEALGVLGQPGQLEVKVAVPPEVLQEFRQAFPREVSVITSGQRKLAGELIAMESQGIREPLDASLTSTCGGTLAVREIKAADGNSTGIELLEPHFTATVQLSPTADEQLFAGQRCVVRLPSGSSSLALKLYGFWQQWQASLAEQRSAFRSAKEVPQLR